MRKQIFKIKKENFASKEGGREKIIRLSRGKIRISVRLEALEKGKRQEKNVKESGAGRIWFGCWGGVPYIDAKGPLKTR